MTAAVYRTTQPSLSVPQTQNTAPVLEFNCLYTHDVRRKQKRWQDGFLRFHTFNKRVMVYDIPRNFIGDTHWKQDEAVQDGDEVTLEKDGVLVQVAESVGQTETDLTELRKSKNKGSSEHGSSPTRGLQTPVARSATGQTQKRGTQLKHRSLNALLGTPKGALGKAALPTKSPFEERTAGAENEQWQDDRPPKRRRVESNETSSVAGTLKTPAVPKKKETPLWARTADSWNHGKNLSAAEQPKSGAKEVIELSDDEDTVQPQEERFLPGFSSDALAPLSSPAKEPTKPNKTKARTVRSSSPASVQPAQNTAATANERAAQDEPTRPRLSKPKHSAATVRRDSDDPQASSLRNTERTNRTVDGGKTTAKERMPSPRPASGEGQTLRMTARSSKKKTLLCQDQLSKKAPSRPSSSSGRGISIGTLRAPTPEPDESGAKSQRQLLDERLARIASKPSAKRARVSGSPSGAEAQGAVGRSDDSSHPAHEHSNVEAAPDAGNAVSTLADLDRMIMPPNELPSRSEPAAAAVSPPLKKDRRLRKVVSDVPHPAAQKRAPGAPLRFTPSPSKRAAPATSEKVVAQPDKASERMPPPPKPRAKKALQRSVSLNTASGGTSAVIISRPFQTPKAPAPKSAPVAETAPDPWSREAFDLFAWRPPGWDEEAWAVSQTAA